jgi:hypothetical protein
MRPRRFIVAVTAAVAVILSAPFVQQLFTVVSNSWGPQSRALGISATAVPIGIALIAAAVLIRDRRIVRYLGLCCSLLLGSAYAVFDCEDGSVMILPLLASVIVGTVDEWFQWFVPIRTGEMRDIILDAVAGVCGLLFALSIEPPDRLVVALDRNSRRRVAACTGALLAVFAFFFVSVHVGHVVRDPRIGTFRSRYTAAHLAELSRDRGERWAVDPPLVLRRLSREDQYLAEGLWRVRRRNLAWEDGDVSTAWRENVILETFYAPILDTPTYVSLERHRWPADQRMDAEQRADVVRTPVSSEEYRYPLFVWPDAS